MGQPSLSIWGQPEIGMMQNLLLLRERLTMADITMCSNQDCPLKDSCYRAQAEPSYWQSYALFEHDGECEWFIQFDEE